MHRVVVRLGQEHESTCYDCKNILVIKVHFQNNEIIKKYSNIQYRSFVG